MNAQGYSIKSHYLDASALVKLVAEDPDEDPGRAILREYYYSHVASLYSTSYCVTETLSVFKRKYQQKRITEDDYIKYVGKFIRGVIGVNLRVEDEIAILNPALLSEAESLFKKYGIDFIDCFQIVTILRGKNRMFIEDSKSILITADRELAKAARQEGARVWECTTEPAPE